METEACPDLAALLEADRADLDRLVAMMGGDAEEQGAARPEIKRKLTPKAKLIQAITRARARQPARLQPPRRSPITQKDPLPHRGRRRRRAGR